MMMTVGVAPGSYTMHLGLASAGPGLPIDPSCPPDEISTGAHGVPMIGWYTVPPVEDVNPYTMVTTAATPPAAGPSVTVKQPMNPYGTQSTLKGLAETMTIGGIRVDILGLVAATILGIGLVVNRLAAKPHRKH